MNILYVADRDTKNGAAISMYQLVKAMLNKYDDINYTILLPKQSIMANKYRELGCEVFTASYGSFYHGYPYKKWKTIFKYVLKGIPYYYGRMFARLSIANIINWDSIDVIHVNNSTDDFGASLSYRYKLPLVWHIREFGDLDFPSYSYRHKYIDYMVDTNALFIPISKAVQNHWISKGILENRMRQVYNIVNTPYICEGKSKGDRGEECLCMLMVGTLIEAKGQHQIIKALGELPEHIRNRCFLDIVGDGNKEYKKLLVGLVKKYHIEKQVKFFGYQADFYSKNGKYDVGIMCSKAEGLGRVTIEYMLLGMPVIASNGGANSEIVINKQNGILFTLENIDELSNAVEFCLNNRDEIRRMGENARRDVEKRFSADTICGEIRSIYNEAVSCNS